ncbi:MAG: TolC family protein [Deltaproteobacteria bacterium]|nr:TolC family protein [Deltaproteobacteria bacterium]
MNRGFVAATAGRKRSFVLAVLLLAAGFLVPAPSPAGDDTVMTLTLEEARSIASGKNRDIRKAMEFRKQVEGRYVQERAAALPQVTISSSVSRTRDESQEALGGGLIPLQQDIRSAEASLSQPLYTWGQIGAGIRAAKIGFATADDQLRFFRQAAARDVTASFYDILLARELHAIAAQNREQKIRHLDEARKRNAAGTATDYDVLAAEVAAENARPEILRTENLIRTSRERLRFLLAVEGREVDASGNLLSAVEPHPGYEETLDTAVKKRPELSELRHRIGISKELVTVANAGDKPRLDLKGGVGRRELDVGTTDANGKIWSAGLFFSYPIFDGLRTRGKVAQAKSELASLRIDEAKLLDSIALEARNAVNAVREAGEIVGALTGTVTQAERLLALAEKGFEYGVKTRLEVEDAELNLTQAKGNLARARRDYLVARVNLEFVKGTLEEEETSGAVEKPWRPAESIPGMVKEVLQLQPRLDRKDDASE